MMAKQANSENLLSDLTCSLCLNLFVMPKSMPSCPHTFCLSCLEQVVSHEERFTNTIRCPECRAINYVGENGVKGFSTNIVVQKIVHKMSLQRRISEQLSDQDDDDDTCNHTLVVEQRQKCLHCDNEFCYACKFRHIEVIKNEIFEASKELSEEKLMTGYNKLAQKIGDSLERDLRTIELQLDGVSNELHRVLSAVDAKISSIRESSNHFIENESMRLKQFVTDFANVPDRELLEQRKRQLGSVSIFKQDLDNVARLFLDISKHNDMVKSFQENVRKLEQPLLVLQPTAELSEMLAKLETLDVGILLANQTELGVESPLEKEMKTLTVNPEVRRPRPRLSLWKQALNWLGGRANQMAGIGKRASSEELMHNPIKRIITLPSRNLFGVFHDGNKISFFDSSKQMKGTTTIALPRDLYRLEVELLAVDDRRRGSIFFTAQATSDEDGELSRRIYRLPSSAINSQTVEPLIFATGEHEDCFKNGLAVSSRFRLVITVERGEIVAYSSADSDSETAGTRVMSWKLCPNPWLHDVEDRYTESDDTIALVISTDDGYLASSFVQVSENPENNRSTKPKIWRCDHEQFDDGPLLRIDSPSKVCYWRRKALVEKDGFLLKYESVDMHPGLVSCLPMASLLTASNVPDNNCDELDGMAALKSDDGHTYAAILHKSEPTFDLLRDVTIVKLT